MEITKLLAGIPIFAGCLPQQLERIGNGLIQKSVLKGDLVFRKGELSDGFYFLREGLVKIAFLSEDGNEKVLDIVVQQQTFGESLMFSDKPLIVYAQALVNSSLLHLPAKIVLDELALDPALARRMFAGMSRSVHQLMSDLESCSLHSGRQRIIEYLLHELPDEEAIRPVVTLKANKSLIASRLNLTKEHFSRILHGLLACGLIGIEGRNVRINDVNQLRMQLP